MVSNTITGNATMKQLQREVLFDTKGQYMKESNTLEDNATIKEQQNKLGLSWAKLSCQLGFGCTVINICCLILIND